MQADRAGNMRSIQWKAGIYGGPDRWSGIRRHDGDDGHAWDGCKGGWKRVSPGRIPVSPVQQRRDWRAFRTASWSLFYGQSEGPCVRAFVRGQLVVPWTADPDATPTRHGHYALPPGNADGFAQSLGAPHFWRDPWRSVSGVRKEELGKSAHCQEPSALPPDSLWDKNAASKAMVKWHNETNGGKQA